MTMARGGIEPSTDMDVPAKVEIHYNLQKKCFSYTPGPIISLDYCSFRSSDTAANRELMPSTTAVSGGLSPLSSIWMLNLS